MTCKDCYHCEACENRFAGLKKICVDEPVKHLELNPAVEKCCENFKDKSLIVELPCKVGRFVYVDTRLFCTDCLKEEVRKLDYTCCSVVNIRYNKNMKSLIYLRPLYRRDFNSRYHIFVPSSAIGTTVFLTEQEAKAKLKELNEK